MTCSFAFSGSLDTRSEAAKFCAVAADVVGEIWSHICSGGENLYGICEMCKFIRCYFAVFTCILRSASVYALHNGKIIVPSHVLVFEMSLHHHDHRYLNFSKYNI